MTMIRSFLFFSLLLLDFSLSAQETAERNTGSFTALSVIGNLRVELYKSDTSRILIEAAGTLPENVVTEMDGNELTIRLKTNTPKDATIRVLVYYKKLESLTVQSHGLITGPEVITGDNVDFEARSGGKMELKLDLTSLNASVIQGAILVFSGNVEKQTISVNTGATYSGYELEARDTYVKASLGGKAKVVAHRIIDATSNFKGYIGYKGEPVSTYIKTNMGGEIANFREEEQQP